jgi:hypothetical protein
MILQWLIVTALASQTNASVSSIPVRIRQGEGASQISDPVVSEDEPVTISTSRRDHKIALLDLSANPGTPEGMPVPTPAYAFGNPAGCSSNDTLSLSPEEMLANVQSALGNKFNLAERRQTYIWNGELGTMLDVTQEKYAYEFRFNEFQPPLTYLGDQVAAVFLTHGFVVWFRLYDGFFRLLAVPMAPGVYESSWAGYLTAYWTPGGKPNDQFIVPVMKKLPCHWEIQQGYVSEDTVNTMFHLNWQIPDYLNAGRRYLASNCQDANRISQKEIGYWDASSMCGPLAWTIMRDANGFPYRIGNWSESPNAFIGANPRWSGQPWSTFDPQTFDLTHIAIPMPGYDFQARGNLYPGDVIYSFTLLFEEPDKQRYDHIFLVAGIGADDARLSISNMVQNYPSHDCYIQEVVLYTPGDRQTGVINHEWNGFGYGITGTTGFDIFRWKWITYHIDGKPINYTVRWGDTLETIAFDWKISPQSVLAVNYLSPNDQLLPGQAIQLPAPEPFVASHLSAEDK